MATFAQMRSLPASPIILAGCVVTMNDSSEIHSKGCICVEGDRIAHVGKTPTDMPSHFAKAPRIETGGTIFPGLVELHNHLPYNVLPLWNVPRLYKNRNIWIDCEPKYDPDIAWPAKILGQNPDQDYPAAVARFSECRSLFGGVTTSEGITISNKPGHKNYFQGLVRNVEAPDDPAWPTAVGHTKDFAPSQIATELWPALQKPRAFFYHLSEGTDDAARQCFLDLELGDKWAINQNLVAIHCTALYPEHFERLAASAGVVWSPLSNFLLYGRTSDIEAAKDAGVTIALGADWSPSGSKNLLGELKIAKIVSDHLGGFFSAEELVRMATSAPATMTQWGNYIGSIEPGKKADFLVVEGIAGDAYQRLLGTRESDILLVLIDGRPRLGRKDILAFDPAEQEIVAIGGRDFVLDLTETTSTPLSGISLSKALAKLTYGLENMPKLGKAFPEALAHALAVAPESTWGLVLDFEEAATSVEVQIAAARSIDPSRLYPMDLSPITEADDAQFRSALRANRNIPNFLRDALT